MSDLLRVLIVEDSESDMLLVLRELRRGGFEPSYKRVDCAEQLHEALGRNIWDFVLSDYSLPGFSGLEALLICHDRDPDLPFIVISGVIGEVTAVEMMRAGAHDYLMKNNLARLVPAIRRELAEAQSRRDRRKAEEDLRANEVRFRSLVQNINDIISILDPQGNFVYSSPSLTRILGHELEGIIGRSIFDFIHPQDKEALQSEIMLLLEGSDGYVAPQPTVLRFIHAGGNWVYLELLGTKLANTPGIEGIVFTSRDISERIHSRESLERYNKRMEILRKMDKAILAAESPSEVALVSLNALRQLVPFDQACVMFYDEAKKITSRLAIWKQDVPGDEDVKLSSELLTLLKKGEPFLSTNLSDGESYYNVCCNCVEKDVCSLLGVPLMYKGSLIGSLNLCGGAVDTFVEEHKEIAREVANQLAISIQQSELIEALQQRVHELTGLHEIALAFNTMKDIRESYGALVERIARLVGGQRCVVMLGGEDGWISAQAPGFGVTDDQVARLRIPFHNSGLPMVSIRSGSIICNSPQEIPLELKEIFQQLDLQNALVAHMGSDQHMIGSVVVMDKPGGFTANDDRLLTVFASQAASMILNAQLFSQTTQALEREKHLNEIAHALSSSLDLDTVIPVFLRIISDLMDVQGVTLSLYTPDNQKLVSPPHYSFPLFKEGYTVGSDRGLAWEIADSKKPSYLNNYSDNPLALEEWVQIGARAFLGVPVMVGETVLGVLALFRLRDNRPFEQRDLEVATAIGNQLGMAVRNAHLYERVQDAAREMAEAYDATIQGWSKALELRDKETQGHCERVTRLACDLAERVGIRDNDLVHFRRGVFLHDIGKMGIPDNILLKPGPLTEDEWVVMRQHSEYARQLLSEIPYLRPALEIPYYHHERWDGSGYPEGLKGAAIPLSARIFAVIDVWDALLSDRPYRPAWQHTKALDYIHSNAGKAFDPDVVTAFDKMLAETGYNY